MGADQSSSSKMEREAKEKYSKEEVSRMLEQQRILFDKKLMSQNQNTALAQHTAREEARKEVERLISEKKKELCRQNIQTSNPLLRTQPQSSIPLERNSAPYSFTGQDLKSKHGTTTLPPAPTPNINLYPNLFKEASSSSAGSSPPRSDVNDPKCGPSVISSKLRGNPSEFVNVSGIQSSLKSVKMTSAATPSNKEAERFSPSAPPAPRDRSISRNRNRARSTAARNNNDDQELNCPTCNDRYTLTIFQCQRGHSSCVHCKNRMACCGVCGLPITNMRNITLEAYICERKICCPNSDDGCNCSIKLADMENHLKECPFREMHCPLTAIFGQCQWRGKLPQMAAHFDDVHQMHRHGNVDTEMRLLNVTHDNQIVYFVVIGTFNFLFHIKVSKQDGMLYMTVQLLGTQNSASKWSYEINIYNKAEPRRKFEYSDICNSINTPINTIFTISKCAVIPLSYVNNFVNNNGITYKFFIRKDFEGRNNNFGNNQRGRGARRRH